MLRVLRILRTGAVQLRWQGLLTADLRKWTLFAIPLVTYRCCGKSVKRLDPFRPAVQMSINSQSGIQLLGGWDASGLCSRCCWSRPLPASRSQVVEAKAAVKAAQATIQRISADIDDSALRAPSAGRAQYRLAQPGEVLGAGGKVISMLDLEDVYMIVFLPETTAGKLAIGAEARLVFDAAPQYVVPARVIFVASEAQFTPKTVETATERQKLVFRVKAQIDPLLLRKYWTRVKAGMPGVAYMRIDPNTPWPQTLSVRLPPQ
jgi:hypothetical protein